MARVGLFAIVAIAAVTAVVFTLDPGLDLRVALFFRDYQSTDAAQQLDSVFAIVREINWHLTILITALPIVAFLIKMLVPRLPALFPPRAGLLIILTMLIGPGLLVQVVFKEQWGRPRPGEVVEFGGPYAFKAWSDPTGECRSNCSFVSGESASAFWLLAPAAAVPAPWTVPAVAGTIVFASVVAFSRVFTTGHFLTDAVFAAVIVSLLVWFAHGLMFRWKATALDDAAIDRWVGRMASAAWSPAIAAMKWLLRRTRNDVKLDRNP